MVESSDARVLFTFDPNTECMTSMFRAARLSTTIVDESGTWPRDLSVSWTIEVDSFTLPAEAWLLIVPTSSAV